MKRADEDADPGMIGDRVVSDIINAALVVADLTDLNPNAFYELGIRHSTELPTIHIAKVGTPLPFDNVAHRTIFVDLTDWHSIESARTRLRESARAVSSPQYKVSNPITQANASFKMRQSEDPRDRLIAELQDRLASIENSLSKPERSFATDRDERSVRDRAFSAIVTMARQFREAGISDPDALHFLKSESFDEAPTGIYFDEDSLYVTFPGAKYSSRLPRSKKVIKGVHVESKRRSQSARDEDSGLQ